MNPNQIVINVKVKNDFFILGVGTFKAGNYPAQQSVYNKNMWTVYPDKGIGKDLLKSECTPIVITSELTCIEMDGLNTRDYPDFCDAYITYAEDKTGRPLIDEEIEELNDDACYVNEQAHKQYY